MLEVIPPEIIDPLGTLSRTQRASRAWYLRNQDRHKRRARLNYWKDRTRQCALRNERYYIRRYLVRAGDIQRLLEHSVDALERAARAFRRTALHFAARANGGETEDKGSN